MTVVPYVLNVGSRLLLVLALCALVLDVCGVFVSFSFARRLVLVGPPQKLGNARNKIAAFK